MNKARIFLSGCNGRMGHVIADICNEYEDVSIVAGADKNVEGLSFPVYASAADVKEEFDVIVDFSHVSAIPSILKLAKDKNCPLVMCTTGLSQKDKEDLFSLSKATPVFYSGNMSLGINILVSLARKATSVLYPEFDIEVIEAHHNQKLDAPSGTALMIADAINDETNNELEYVYDRHSTMQKRDKKELGLHSIRGGNIVGEHSVIFAGPEETITLSHSAMTRNVFARGAVAAARYMVGKKPGLYDMENVINS